MPEAGRPLPLLRDPNLHVVFSVTLMAILGVSSITPAFPKIAGALDVSPQAVGLLIAVFSLPGAVLTPFLGVLADRVGRRKVLAPSLFVFAVAGVACGFARDFEMLLALRLLQGVGAAAMGALNLTIIGDLYDGHRRTEALGYNAAVLSVGTAVYPAVGGVLAMLAWYAPFFLPVLAVPVGVAVLVLLRNPEPQAPADLRAYLTGALRLMRSRVVLSVFAAGLVTFILLYGAFLTYLPFVLEGSFGASALGIGLAMAAASIATGVASFYLGRMARSWGEGRLVKLGFLIYVLTLPAMPLAGSLALLVVLIMLFGAANGLNIPSIITIIAGATPSEYRAVFMSVNGTLLRLGQTLGPLVAGAAYAGLGLTGTFVVSAALGAAMLLVLVLLVPDREPARV
jgi:predicted MFS family arabinose efflux permease